MKTAQIIQLHSCAHVGHTQSGEDMRRICETWEWMHDNGFELANKCKSDFLDLRNGRDFLAETKQYEAVVLHFLFRGGFGFPLENVSKQMAVSHHQSGGAWIRRLKQCNPRVIFAFGGVSEIGGTFIGILEGYKAVRMESDGLSIFVKEDCL